MKRTLLSYLLTLFMYTLEAQDTHLNDAVDTLKEHISLVGYAQVGYTYDDAGGEASNTFDIERAMFMARGKITNKWPYYFTYNFTNIGKILEAYTEYRLLLQLTTRIGQFKTMCTIENPMLLCFVELINCYSQAVNYLTDINGSSSLYGPNSGRDIGIFIYGGLFKKKLSYDPAIMNGQGIDLKDKSNQKDVVDSLMVHPLDQLLVGSLFIKGKGCAVAASSINPGIAAGDGYTRNRWSAGITIQTRPTSLRTEYLAGKDGHVKSDGYYATASIYILPKFDIIVSYDYFNKDKAQDYKQNNYVADV